MVMDFPFSGLPDSTSGFEFDDGLPGSDQSPNVTNGLKLDESLNLNFMEHYVIPPSPDFGNFSPFMNGSAEADSPDSDPVLKYLNQILLEEQMEEKPSMFHDPLALEATEKSLYEVIGKKYPPSPFLRSPAHIDLNTDSPDSFFGSTSENSTSSGTSGGTSVDPQWGVNPGDHKSPVGQSHHLNGSSRSSLTYSGPPEDSINSPSSNTNWQAESLVNMNLISSILSDSESMLQFQRGMEEAKKFLPTNNQLIIDLDQYDLPPKSDEEAPKSVVKLEKDEKLIIDLDQYDLPPKSDEEAPKSVVKLEKDEKNRFAGHTRGRKHLHRQNSELEEQRSSKQSAIYEEEVELSELFDRVLLCSDLPGFNQQDVKSPTGVGQTLQQNGHVSSNGKTQSKRQAAKTEAVDLRTLLVSCAQAVASDDRRTANELLKQIRQYASPTGDACQRLANIFANGIEARLAGTGTQVYASLASKRISASEKLRAYQVYLSACPFKKIAICFANKMISKTAEKASTLHIVEFGISYGFHWPMLIQLLSNRPGGPPKLRITGIELPQAGFRPAELIEETGRRLENYCKRFKVPFEYQAIATQRWEEIRIEELKLARDEVLAVTSLCRFKNLLDETVSLDNPRDGVLKLIRSMRPDIFVHTVVNGSYSAPFFVTRFREALFYYSSLFDMLDVTVHREDQHRFNFEKEFYGREVVNVIACEGAERVERPETYKQWQIRTMRAGFKPLPLDQELMNELKGVKEGYHKDFVFDEDNNWMLQGWKGRILYGCSCWVPA